MSDGAMQDRGPRVKHQAARAQEIRSKWLGDFMVGRDSISGRPPYQVRVKGWMLECFGALIAADQVERNHRFAEEAAELTQALGMPRSEWDQLLDYVYGRPAGEPHQEVGGVMVTLAALCQAQGLDMELDGETELARILRPEIVQKIRAKQAAKPKFGPLPVEPAAPSAPASVFQPGQRIICERDLFMEAGPRAFSAGQEYVVLKIRDNGNACVANGDFAREHWLGEESPDHQSWARHFRPAHVEAQAHRAA
jgi:hypothetical protein